MPGLSQLKQFNKDLLSLGDEITIRASRGEKPVQVVIPKEIEDINDSEDFVLGMPEIEAEPEVTAVDEDLSDLAGLAAPASSEGTADAAAAFEAPDLSSLLNPINIPDDASAGTDMPDLSMFEEIEEPEEEVIEEEPEEISIADMGLDALLSGGAFDGSDEPQEEPEAEEKNEPLSLDDFEEVTDIDTLDTEPASSTAPDDGLSELERDLFASIGGNPAPVVESKNEDTSLDSLLGNLGLGPDGEEVEELADSVEDLEEPVEELENIDEPTPADLFDTTELDDIGGLDNLGESGDLADIGDLEDLGDLGEAGDLGDLGDLGAAGDLGDLGDLGAAGDLEDLGELGEAGDLGDIGDLGAAGDLGDLGELGEAGDLGDLGDLGEAGDLGELGDLGAADDLEDLGDLGAAGDLGDLGDLGAAGDLGDLGDLGEAGDLGDIGELGEAGDLGDLGDLGAAGDLGDLGDLGAADDLEDLGDLGGAGDLGDLGDLGAAGDLEDLGDLGEAGDLGDLGDLGAAGDLGDLGDLGAAGDLEDLGDLGTSTEFDTTGLEDFDNQPVDDFDTSGLDDAFSMEDTETSAENSGSFSLDDMDFGSSLDSTPVDFDAGDEIPDYGDEIEDSGSDSEFEESMEVFDTSDMDGMDFGIPDTDAQLDGSADSDFEFGGENDFAMEGEFEIPGFSDVQTAKEEKTKTPLVGKKGKNLPTPDFSDAEEGDDLPPNTLSDSQYKQFLKNLGEYPLNVRLAFEDLIVQDEFTDDAEFEVIEKILNKAPARQVASMLEKMLDISIPVPRDFEHRTAEEYEAYKKSLSYQLKNKIIPGLLVGIVAILVMWGLFNFSKNCIYKPLKASKLYKQGYALLEADEYPQSEMKFEEAVSYRINKKWFFNYARGYRAHRQYQRAGNMYDRILKYYKHDKAAGLEYADMELNELANYKRAEEIIRREVLDYHINDADGILKLGDIFLEWGTEKEPEKLENAREQYATLIQLYGGKDLYLSRMMRYFVRSDNLRQVIQMKNAFDGKEKVLSAEDLTELSGYLLEKYYGPLAPSDEYLRYEIEGLRGLLLNAVKADKNNPIALYNLAKYFIQSGELGGIESTLQNAIEKFNTIQSMKKRDIYKYIDSYRLLGEHYIDTTDYLQAQEQFAEGISLYTTERDNAGFEGTPDVGKLYADMGNIKYTISGDYDEALMNYKYSVELENDTPSIRYRIGYIQYKNKNYVEALGSFMKAGDGNIKQRNLLLAMANTLSLRGDDYAAQGYYNQLIDSLDAEIVKRGVVFPQASIKDYDVVNTYLSAANNYGVTLYKLAKRTGNSGLNAQAIVQFQQSLRAWDALTRNQETMVRLGGSNLAEQNIQYITHPIPEFEPAIYTDIAKTLLDNEHL